MLRKNYFLLINKRFCMQRDYEIFWDIYVEEILHMCSCEKNAHVGTINISVEINNCVTNSRRAVEMSVTRICQQS